MEFTAKQIADFIQGKIEGNENATVNTFAKIFYIVCHFAITSQEPFHFSQTPNTHIIFMTQSRQSYWSMMMLY